MKLNAYVNNRFEIVRSVLVWPVASPATVTISDMQMAEMRTIGMISNFIF